MGLLGLLALQMVAIRGNMMSRNFGEAIGIAQQRLEIAGTHALRQPVGDAGRSGVHGQRQHASRAALRTSAQPRTPSSTQAIYDRCTVVTVNANNTTDRAR